MKAFLGGLIIGGAAAALAFYGFIYEKPDPFKLHYPENPENGFFAVQPITNGSGMIIPHTNFRLGSQRVETLEEYDIDADAHFLLTERVPLLELDPADVNSVCLMPTTTGEGQFQGSVEAYVFLQDDARARIRDLVMAREGKSMSFEAPDGTLSTFVADASVANSYTGDGQDRTDYGDLSFSFGPESLLQGLSRAHRIAGDNPVERCFGDGDLEAEIPGYKAFKETYALAVGELREMAAKRKTEGTEP
jgi:hypothetical protein